jgi:EAL domain-containing protein (putative c-di-GMP-specific phosphodiesterase class I)
MVDVEDIIDKLNRLKELGLQLALDDFGTGYSSLSTLRLFPIDTLKIDRAFISQLGIEQGATAIVEAISAMAKSMRIEVTGEGVETAEQREIISHLGCNTGQGYFYDRPLSIQEFTARTKLTTTYFERKAA